MIFNLQLTIRPKDSHYRPVIYQALKTNMKSTITLKRPDQARKYNLARSHSKCGRLIYRQINGPYWYPIVWSRFIELSGNDAKEVTWFLSRDQFNPSHNCLKFPQNISSSDRVVLLCMGGSTLGQLGAQLEDYERLVVEPLHCILSLLWVSSGSTYLLRKNKNMK